MALLTIQLLGPPRLTLAGTPLDLRVRKELALLAFLAVEQGRRHSRDSLVGLIWPELPEEAARNNLRVALAGLRRLLGPAADGLLSADRQQLQWLTSGDHSLDVAAFRALHAEVAAHAHSALESCEACVARLAAAADHYNGDFLAGFSLPDSSAFEEWRTLQRESLHQQQLATLETLAVAHELREDHAGQVAYGRRLLALEPWREAAHDLVIRGLWSLGERGAALEQYERCCRILADELGLEPSPELAALAARLRTAPPGGEGAATQQPAVAVARPTHNLPAALTPLVGRERELEALEALLRRPELRLLTLTGPGGIGKTSLALELARRVLPAYRDGVFLLQLAPLRQPEVVAGTLLTTLGVKPAGAQAPDATLAAWLRDRQLLLLLDNCEHLLAIAPLIGELLAAAPGLTVLATSREPLRLYGEQLFPVPPLALPPELPEKGHGATAIAQYAAVALFVQRLQAVRPAFTLTTENAAAVAALCARLDGLPLALELAAARGQHLSPQRMLEHLQRGAGGLELLAGPGRDRAPRQQTLETAIAWSYALLSPAEQAGFCRLGVFAGGWSEAAAEVVAGAGEQLYALVEKSLVVASEGPDGAPRFSMLETIREYALAQLGARGEAEATQRAHAHVFLALAEAAEPQLSGGKDEQHWWAQLSAEEDNLRAALRWCVETGERLLGLRLAGAFWKYWDLSSAYHEGRGWLAGLLDLRGPEEVPPAVCATALNGLAMLAMRLGDGTTANASAEASLAHFRALGDGNGVSRALLTLGNIATLIYGDRARSRACFAEALTLQRATDNKPGMAVTYFNLGRGALSQGDSMRARQELEAAHALYSELGSKLWMLRVKPHLATALLLAGEQAWAAALLAEALGSWPQSLERDQTIAAQVVLVAAGIAAARHEPQRAAVLLGALEPLAQAMGGANWRGAAKKDLHETITATVREQLDAATFVAARAAGSELSTVQALVAAHAVVTPEQAPAVKLPAPLTSLVGRAGDVEAVVALFRKPEIRLVSLIGLGGIGKTRLALAAAWAVGGQVADGVWWVPLAGVELSGDQAAQADLLAAIIARACERPLAGRQPLAELAAALRERAALLAIDNCEHLPAVGAVLRVLLEAAPRLRVLVTSRVPLGLEGEHLLRLEGLTVPADDAADPTTYASVQLFMERAATQAPGWQPDTAELADVARLCRLLDGMPLAIELAAHWVGHYSPAEIAAALEADSDLLAARGAGLPERQRSLRTVFAYSWRLLSADERAALARLSVFRGGFDRVAAQAVARVKVPTLAALTDASLVRQPGVGQYSLHELLRQFAAEELAALEPDGDAHDRHATYFLALLAQQELPLRGPQPHAATAVIEHHGDNIRQALSHTLSRRQWAPLAEAVHALALYYRIIGLVQRGLQLLETIAAALAADRADDHREPDPARRSLGATLQALRGYFLGREGHTEQALAATQLAAAEARAIGAPLLEALALLHDATTDGAMPAHSVQPAGIHRELQARLERAVLICRSYRPAGAVEAGRASAIEAESLYLMSRFLNARGRHQEALERGEAALRVCRAAENRHLESKLSNGLAEALESMGRFGEARPLREQALAFSRSIGGLALEGVALNNLAGNLLYLGDYAGALPLALAAYKLYRELGINAAALAHTVSWVSFHQGEHAIALDYADRTLELGGGSAARRFGLLARGDALGGLGRWDEADGAFAQVLELGRATEFAQLRATALAGLARVALARGETRAAHALADEILTLLAAGMPASVYEPMRTYETCYLALAACADPRAPAVLRTAHATLVQQAAWIAEPTWQRSFLENVAAHRAILAEAERSPGCAARRARPDR